MPTLKQYLSTLKLRWEKVEPRAPAFVCKCTFCKQDILDNETFYKMSGIDGEDGVQLFTLTKNDPDRACVNCAKAEGLQW